MPKNDDSFEPLKKLEGESERAYWDRLNAQIREEPPWLKRKRRESRKGALIYFCFVIGLPLLFGPFTLIGTILLAIAWFAITENKGR